MRRAIRALPLVLLISAAVNVPAAWVLAHVRMPRAHTATWDGETICHRRTSLGVGLYDLSYTNPAREPIWIEVYTPGSPPAWIPRPALRGDLHSASVRAGAFGWPFHAVGWAEGDQTQHHDRSAREVVDRWSSGRYTAPWQARTQYVYAGYPCRVIPVGFMLNTLVYAAALILLPACVRELRRRRRAARGRCPLCAYDLVGDLTPGCPECGWGRDPAPHRPPSGFPLQPSLHAR